MATDLLDLKERIAWCAVETDALEAETDRFIASGAYRFHHEVDPGTGDGTFFVTLTKPLPKSVAIKAGSILHELRATLDSLACTLAVRNGRTPKQVYFAVCEDEPEFVTRGLNDKLKKLSDEHRAEMARLKPWRDGNPLLHALHHADLTRKHQRLITVNTDTGRLAIGSATNADFVFIRAGIEVTDTPTAFMRIRKGGYADLHLGVEIRMGEPPALEGSPVVGVLRDFADLAKSIVERFD